MMDTLEILSRIQIMTEHWEKSAINLSSLSTEKETEIRKSAAMDFRILQKAIEKSLDEMAEGLAEQENQNKENENV